MLSLGRWTGWRIGRTSPVEFAALALLGLFMAALGPFGTAEVSLPSRLVFWSACMLGGGLVAALIEPLLFLVPALMAAPRLRAIVQAAAMTVPIALLVNIINHAVFGGPLNLRSYLGLLPQVLVIDVAVVLLAWMIRTLSRPAEPVRPVAPLNPLADRLPPPMARAGLIAVEAEDHYLRIHTEVGDTLVHMRFADALETLTDADGLRVHRSWWVARAAVQATSWRDGRGQLVLSNGVKAPVSRSFAREVKATNWG